MFTAPCQLLEWDSSFFGFRVARINGDSLTPELTREIDRYCVENYIDCLYFLARSDDSCTTSLAEDAGFNLVDVRMELIHGGAHSLNVWGDDVVQPVLLREARSRDIGRLRIIAGRSYRETRFFYDNHFPRHLSVLLYQEWISRSFEGYADQVLIAEADQEPVGYITCHLDESTGVGTIGLFGVDEEMRGRGIGKALVNGALDWFASRQFDKIRVITQGRNLAAQRLYQRCGFLTESVHLWYHKWYDTRYGE